MGLVGTVVTAIWVMLPAYLPNNTAVIAGGGRPIDGWRSWRGRRVLGDGKTWRGTFIGIIAGMVVAIGLNLGRGSVQEVLGIALPGFPVTAIVGLPAGAMLGDTAASFVKRRTGRDRGAPFPGIDQLDFVVGALLLVTLIDTEWAIATFTIPVILAILILTPILHVGTNVLGYLLGFKQEPY